MQPRLKEDPKEWRNFTLLCCGIALFLCAGAARKGAIGREWIALVCGMVSIAGLVAIWHPQSFRAFYRTAMIISFRVGLVMGKVTLTFVYLLVVTPLGAAMRLSGKDPLNIRRSKDRDSYWREARASSKFDQQF